MEIIIYIFAIISIIGLFFSFVLAFQQQFYECRRYLSAIYRRRGYRLTLALLLILIFGTAIYFDKDYLYLIAIATCTTTIIFTSMFKRRIIKLRLTPRIWRLFACYIFLTAIIIGCCIMFPLRYLAVTILGIYLLAPLLIILASLLARPFERSISAKFVRSAKEKIKSNPDLKIIAITGSFGKTSVKHFLYQLICDTYKTLATPKSVNTLMGLTSIINNQLSAVDQVFIAEMGVDRLGGMDRLLSLFTPDIALVTTVGSQHLATFKSVENIFLEKTKIYTALKPKGIAIINSGDTRLEKLSLKNKMISYGRPSSNVYPINVKQGEAVTTFSLMIDGKEEKGFATTLIGKHAFDNLIAALTIALTLQVPLYKLKQNVRLVKSVPHRLEVRLEPNAVIIDDSYNSNFAGFTAALKELARYQKYKILITPGLIELGKSHYQTNFALAKDIVDSTDFIYLVGESNVKPLVDGLDSYHFKNYLVVKTFRDAYKAALNSEVDKVILIENDLPDVYIK